MKNRWLSSVFFAIFLLCLGIIQHMELEYNLKLLLNVFSLVGSIFFVINQYRICIQIEKQKLKALILATSSSAFILTFALDMSMIFRDIALIIIGVISYIYISSSIKETKGILVSSITKNNNCYKVLCIVMNVYISTGIIYLEKGHHLWVNCLYLIMFAVLILCSIIIFIKERINRTLIFFFLFSLISFMFSVKINGQYVFFKPIFSFWIYFDTIIGFNFNIIVILLLYILCLRRFAVRPPKGNALGAGVLGSDPENERKDDSKCSLPLT